MKILQIDFPSTGPFGKNLSEARVKTFEANIPLSQINRFPGL